MDFMLLEDIPTFMFEFSGMSNNVCGLAGLRAGSGTSATNDAGNGSNNNRNDNVVTCEN
jgi:hypothetical protein